ncbi:MAG: hypothetical protein WD029_10900 [Microthrixaceae bacterium]
MPSTADELKIEQLQSSIQQLRKDLLTTRDALLGTQAESATLKVQNREYEVRLAQVNQALIAANHPTLATHNRIMRVIKRAANHRITKGLVRRVKSL